jgi:hypothetical protein
MTFQWLTHSSKPTKRDRKIIEAKAIMDRIGTQLVIQKKETIQLEYLGATKATSKSRDRDLLSLLMRNNMSANTPPSQRLSDEDVLAREPSISVYFTQLLTIFLSRNTNISISRS